MQTKMFVIVDTEHVRELMASDRNDKMHSDHCFDANQFGTTEVDVRGCESSKLESRGSESLEVVKECDESSSNKDTSNDGGDISSSLEFMITSDEKKHEEKDTGSNNEKELCHQKQHVTDATEMPKPVRTFKHKRRSITKKKKTKRQVCVVPGCSVRAFSNRFVDFPADREKRNKWIELTKIKEKFPDINPADPLPDIMALCMRHFEEGDFNVKEMGYGLICSLKDGVDPSIFPWDELPSLNATGMDIFANTKYSREVRLLNRMRSELQNMLHPPNTPMSPILKPTDITDETSNHRPKRSNRRINYKICDYDFYYEKGLQNKTPYTKRKPKVPDKKVMKPTQKPLSPVNECGFLIDSTVMDSEERDIRKGVESLAEALEKYEVPDRAEENGSCNVLNSPSVTESPSVTPEITSNSLALRPRRSKAVVNYRIPDYDYDKSVRHKKSAKAKQFARKLESTDFNLRNHYFYKNGIPEKTGPVRLNESSSSLEESSAGDQESSLSCSTLDDSISTERHFDAAAEEVNLPDVTLPDLVNKVSSSRPRRSSIKAVNYRISDYDYDKSAKYKKPKVKTFSHVNTVTTPSTTTAYRCSVRNSERKRMEQSLERGGDAEASDNIGPEQNENVLNPSTTSVGSNAVKSPVDDNSAYRRPRRSTAAVNYRLSDYDCSKTKKSRKNYGKRKTCRNKKKCVPFTVNDDLVYDIKIENCEESEMVEVMDNVGETEQTGTIAQGENMLSFQHFLNPYSAVQPAEHSSQLLLGTTNAQLITASIEAALNPVLAKLELFQGRVESRMDQLEGRVNSHLANIESRVNMCLEKLGHFSNSQQQNGLVDIPFSQPMNGPVDTLPGQHQNGLVDSSTVLQLNGMVDTTEGQQLNGVADSPVVRTTDLQMSMSSGVTATACNPMRLDLEPFAITEKEYEMMEGECLSVE